MEREEARGVPAGGRKDAVKGYIRGSFHYRVLESALGTEADNMGQTCPSVLKLGRVRMCGKFQRTDAMLYLYR